MDIIKKWLLDLKSETPIFVQLCRTIVKLIKKVIRKEDVTIDKAQAIALQKQTVKVQILLGACAVTLLFVVFHGCGSSSSDESRPNTTSAPFDKIESSAKQSNTMPRTAQEAFRKKVDSTLSQLAFVRGRPAEGEIWENNVPLITVLQTVDGGVLAEMRRCDVMVC